MESVKNWLCDLLNEIEDNKNTEIYIDLLKKCGANCAKRNALPHVINMKTEVSRLKDMDAIADAINRHTGAECVPKADGFIITYNRDKGCDCSLVSGGYVASPIFCNCTKGFHETLWGTIFEKPVEVDLLETFLRGGTCCSYRVKFMQENL